MLECSNYAVQYSVRYRWNPFPPRKLWKDENKNTQIMTYQVDYEMVGRNVSSKSKQLIIWDRDK